MPSIEERIVAVDRDLIELRQLSARLKAASPDSRDEVVITMADERIECVDAELTEIVKSVWSGYV